MSSNNARGAFIPDSGVSVPSGAPGMHPLILERIKLIAAAKRAIILAQLDRLIDALDRLFQLTGRFSSQADTARAFRKQVALVTVGSPESLLLLDQLKQHMADITNSLTAGDATTNCGKTTNQAALADMSES